MRAERLIHAGTAYSPAPGITPPSRTALLTIRELEVAKLKAEGNQHKEIADKLGISKKTADTYVNSIYRKLGIHSVALLTKWAINSGLVDL